MNWQTYPLGGGETVERARRMAEKRGVTLGLSHAVNTATGKPLCRISPLSLCWDTSCHAPGELPDCPACLRAIKKAQKELANPGNG